MADESILSDDIINRGLTTAGFTRDDRGYKQQTFLGASIRKFSMQAGFGDASSTLNVDLIEDEYNKSDESPVGTGDDVYHNGQHDKFVPPFIGSPVFFKFGKDHATVEQAFLGIYDYIYASGTTSSGVTWEPGGYSGSLSGAVESMGEEEYYDIDEQQSYKVAQDENIGRGHIAFGGILQSVIENRTPEGNPAYSVQVTDPREILQSVQIILNNFTGSINKTDNLYNVYGFLEHNLSEDAAAALGEPDPVTRNVEKSGKVTYSGSDTYKLDDGTSFPMTGTGFSRRSNQGIPFYRVAQAMNALFAYEVDLPEEYVNMSFGDKINFRGFKYVVDFSGLPAVPDFYNLDYDNINLLDLALEICEITNTDLYVTLLPVIDHPGSAFLYQKNAEVQDDADLVVGIIRLDAIDRKKQPKLGAIQEYLNELENDKIYVKNRDVGFELSNITTDKFIAGAQETSMYFFSSNADKDKLSTNNAKQQGNGSNVTIGDQWYLSNAVQQQIVPYYGTLGNNRVSIPRGWGAYQQILLDATGLSADGVGNYYVTTEMELRCALAGYDKWVQFLMEYNNKYLEPVESASGGGIAPDGEDDLVKFNESEQEYAVTVPRSVFPTYEKDEFLAMKTCNPPFGWPLYFERATNIGIPQAGLVSIQYFWTTQVLPDLLKAKQGQDQGLQNAEKYQVLLNHTWDNILSKVFVGAEGAGQELKKAAEELAEKIEASQIALAEERIENSIKTSATFSKFFKKGTKNAKRIHTFLHDIANECLGKKFLVKIPRNVNTNYKDIETGGSSLEKSQGGIYTSGPFGFRPQPKTSEAINKHDKEFVDAYLAKVMDPMIPTFLSSEITTSEYLGALNSNYNPFSDSYDFNYEPDSQGGFFDADIHKELLTVSDSLEKADAKDNGYMGLKNQLIPVDIENFITDSNRIHAYVRFDHSEDLSFGSMNKNDFTQEQIVAGRSKIPDISYSLDNIEASADEPFRFGSDPEDKDDPSVAFVKCAIDDQFYYLPQIVPMEEGVYGKPKQKPLVSQPREVYDPATNSRKTVATYATAYFYPDPNDAGSGGAGEGLEDFKTVSRQVGSRASNYIDVEVGASGNPEHVYALITLPTVVQPTKDSRFRDGPYQLFRPESVKHFLTMDVVKNFPPFNDIPHVTIPTTAVAQETCGSTDNESVVNSALTVLDKLQYAFPQQIDFYVPSPVIPDLAVLPLMSHERCYGPWSSQWIDSRTPEEQEANEPIETRFIELGGPVDFIKDENLSPWNYAGYTGLNQAGKLQAQFANNLLLMSERGGFVYADAPKNVYLAEELKERGPLVTDINVSISEAGIMTTVKLDLYTVSFGKLQKHRQDNLQKISREKQKLRDEKNALIRKNMGKNQRSEDYQTLYKKIEHEVKSMANADTYSLGSAASAAVNFIASNVRNITDGFNLGGDQGSEEITRFGTEISTQSSEDVANVSENFNSFVSAARSFVNSAGGSLKDIFTAGSMEPGHTSMAFRKDPFNKTKQDMYPPIEVGNVEPDDLTTYEE